MALASMFFLLFVASLAASSFANECRVADAAISAPCPPSNKWVAGSPVTSWEPAKSTLRKISVISKGYKHKNYLFMGPDFVTLDENNAEESVENKADEWSGLSRLDAALMWKDGNSWYNSWYPAFFEGSSYYYYSYLSIYGAYPVVGEDSTFPPELELEKGIEATATVGDESYFMKCCNFMVYDHETQEITHKGSLEDHGIPCDVHAALEMSEGVLGVIKFDQLWAFHLDSRNVTGPMDANEAFGLQTLRLCGEHEDAGESIGEQ